MAKSKFLRRLISDLRVELSDEFDRNFERKAFFSKRWTPRRYHNPKGTLLMVTGALRRSVKAHETDHGVRFTSNVPYASIHNEGGRGLKPVKAHYRRTKSGKTASVKAHMRRFDMPQRQSWMPWLMNLMSLPIFVNYINVKWRVKNSRNLNKSVYL